MTRRLLLVGMVAVLLAADKPQTDDSKKKLEIEGKWSVVKAYTGSEPAPAEDVEKMSVQITAKSLTVQFGPMQHESDIKVSPSKKPKEIDMTPKDGQYEGKALEGIYTLEGNTLTLYFAKPESPRPTAIPTQGRNGYFLLVLKRKK